MDIAFRYAHEGNAESLRHHLSDLRLHLSGTSSSSDGNNLLNQVSADRRCTMLYTAARLGHFDCVLVLLCGSSGSRGADVNKKNEGADASTPLHGACYGGHPAIVALLMQYGAYVGMQNGHKETPKQNAQVPAKGTDTGRAAKCAEILGDAMEAKRVLLSELRSNAYVKVLQRKLGRLLIPGVSPADLGSAASDTVATVVTEETTKKRGREEGEKGEIVATAPAALPAATGSTPSTTTRHPMMTAEELSHPKPHWAATPCRYHKQPKGCANGSVCPFQHDDAPPTSSGAAAGTAAPALPSSAPGASVLVVPAAAATAATRAPGGATAAFYAAPASMAKEVPTDAGHRSYTLAPADVSITVPSPSPSAPWGKLTDTLIFRDAGTAGQLKSLPASTQLRVAAFDMDDCLIYPKMGKTFPKSADDWQWLISRSAFGVPPGADTVSKLRTLSRSYHIIMIYSNQEKIGKDPAYGATIKKKIDTLARELQVPLYAMCSIKKDGCRKPAACGWEAFSAWVHANTGGKKIDMTLSFYCGDAAGRTITTLAGRGKDFSCSDRKFAYNAKLQFYTPEELFLAKAPAPFSWGDGMTPELATKLRAQIGSHHTSHALAQATAPGPNLILMVGPPGSGKSTFYHTYLKSKGYEWVNQDTLKTKAKVEKAVTEGLAAGKLLCVDKTNPSLEDRQWFIRAVHGSGGGGGGVGGSGAGRIRCVHMDVPPNLVSHMNALRGALPDSLKHSDRVPAIAGNMYSSRFTRPSAGEGFDELVNLPFIPNFSGRDDRSRAILEERFFWLSHPDHR